MPYVVEHIKDAGYVTVTLTGDVTMAELIASREEAASQLAENDCTSLLVDATRVARMQSIFDDFAFTSQHRSYLPPPIRTAVVIQQAHLDHMRFVENVARNRGVKLTLFIEREEALRWLFEHKPDAGRLRI